MINANMRKYDYYLLTENEYGQSTIPKDAMPDGQVKLSVYLTSQTAQDNILYKDCSYMALTHDTGVNDTFVIDINGERCKVLYVSPQGRFRAVFLKRVD